MARVLIGSRAGGLSLHLDDHADGVAVLDVPGLEATTRVEQSYVDGFADLLHFFESALSDWRGWDGTRAWASVDGALHLAATHHGGGIALEVVLQDVALSWRAEAGVDIEPGEQLRAIVDDLTALVDSGRSQR